MIPAFASTDPKACAFYDSHGYVVLAPQLSPDERAGLRRALDSLWARYAAEQAVSLDHYVANISQWRDLWRHDQTFRATLEDPRLWSTAARFMGRAGARLLHDHVIVKPASASGTVPWHQDYPYWPVDTDEGLSCWCPLEDVGLEGGCLEVIDGSHRWGESPPADFLADDRSAFDARPDRVRLPVQAGSVVVLNSLTWHRSGPNREAGRRAAYISLWLPPDARYAPEHSGWHPVNERVTVRPGEILNDDWFPCFGEREIRRTGPRPLAHAGPRPREGLSMFNASAKIAGQLRRILAHGGHPGELAGGIGQLLAQNGAVEAIVRETIANGIAAPGDEGALRNALDQLRISSEAYRLHRARNVYNGAYVEWWQVAGRAWAERLEGAAASEANP
jgi:ectoine hydroxylase-related dioxygenase (phytanoyl-CoA dioxygenase family)